MNGEELTKAFEKVKYEAFVWDLSVQWINLIEYEQVWIMKWTQIIDAWIKTTTSSVTEISEIIQNVISWMEYRKLIGQRNFFKFVYLILFNFLFVWRNIKNIQVRM